jgi:aspartate 1-decarboxylase
MDYEGSIAIDSVLLKEANLPPGKQANAVNINNGSRIVTYVIEAPANSGTIMPNGHAAQMSEVGNLIIGLFYSEMTEIVRSWKSNIVYVNEGNRPRACDQGYIHDQLSRPHRLRSSI